ncbi:MAG TPA: hypothetical protein VM911_22435 [Pyrinomonadaceae bacterium]|jgi:hypothetical protein|nr:hypothetical protein [Pyrinomonadaceae bacterium]
MLHHSPPPLTEEQQKLLQQEAFISEILKIRELKERRDKNGGWFVRLLESAGGAALITVLVGGILGGLLNWRIQTNLRDREAAQAIQKTQGELALVAYKDFLDRRQETIKSVYELLGNSASASYALITITGPEFEHSKLPAEAEEQKTAIRDRFNVAVNEWRSRQDNLGALLSYYHEGRPDVVDSWNNTKSSLTAYMKCAQDEWNNYSTDYIPRDTTKLCSEQRQNYEKNLQLLTQGLENTRRYLWKDFTKEK